MWTDSKTVILWINSEARNYKPYVMHRIAEILENSEGAQWRWVPTSLNPADAGTRPANDPSFARPSIWVTGPQFLYSEPIEWPSGSTDFQPWEVPDEVRQSPTTILLTVKARSAIHDVTRFEKYEKLLRTIGWVYRIFDRSSRDQHLQPCEVERAKKYLCRQAQREVFSSEIEALETGKEIAKSSSIWKLNPSIDDEGLLRIVGRIDNADIVPWCTRRPIILPRRHQLTDLILHYHHRAVGHQRNETVVCRVREKFWVQSIRVELNRVIQTM